MGLDPSSGRQDCCLWQHVSPTYSSDSLYSPCNYSWSTTPSWLSTAVAAAHPNKTAPFLRARGTDRRFARHVQSPIFAGYPRTGGAAQDVHVAPGYGPWRQTFSRSITVWTQPGDLLRTENDGSNLWKRLRSSQGHARDDDEVWHTVEPRFETLAECQ